MATLEARLVAVVQRIRDQFNAIRPRLLPTGGVAGQVLTKKSGTENDVGWTTQAGAFEFVIDGGGVALTTGVKGELQVPFDCVLTGWTLTSDAVGSVVVDVSRATYTGWPTTTVITASAKPTISSDRKATSAVLTGWTTSLVKDDILTISVNSASAVTRLTLVLKLARN